MDEELDPLAMPEEQEDVQVPMAPLSLNKDEAREASGNRFKDYLEAQLRVNDRRQSPEYLASRDQQRNAIEGAKGDANLGALLMDSAAKFGTAGGKQVQSDYGKFAEGLRGNLDKYQAGQDQMQKEDDAASGKQAQLYQYLAAQKQQEESNKMKQTGLQIQRDKLGIPKWNSLSGAKDSQGFPIERDQFGNTRRIPGAGPEEPGWKTEASLSDADGNMLQSNKRGQTRVAIGPDGQPIKSKAADKALPKVPAGEAVNLGGYESLDKTIDSLGDSFRGYTDGKSDLDKTLSYLGSGLPGTTSDAAKYNQEARRAAQAIGTVLEKGKLTDADYEAKYLPMMPKWGDSEEVKQAKLEGLKDYARQKQTAELNALTQAGYATENFKPLDPFTRTPIKDQGKSGTATAAPATGGKQVVKQQYSPSRNQTRITYSDGTTEVKDGR